jgi:hypothetical protein
METVNDTNPTPTGTQQQVVPNSTAVLVLGILSIVTCWTNGFVGIILGIIALALSGKGQSAYRSNPGMYTVASYNNLKSGKVCAIIGLSLSGLFLLIVLSVLGFAFSAIFSTLPWHAMFQ